MKRIKHASHENHERWLVSYADFITLLFAFFVVMFASSQADKGKAKQISESVSRALEESTVSKTAAAVAKVLGGTVDDKGQGSAQMKGPGGAQKAAKEAPPDEIVELLPSLKILSKELKTEIASGKVEVHLEARGLVISLKEAILFPSGSDVLGSGGNPTVNKVANTLRAVPNPIRLEGHTDSVPIQSARFRSNWELSSARAIAMLESLTHQHEIPAKRLAIVGYADTVPVGSNDTPEGRAQNRRVDVVILSVTGLSATPGARKAPPEKPSPASH
jgi:chemotaxis protein MotB